MSPSEYTLLQLSTGSQRKAWKLPLRSSLDGSFVRRCYDPTSPIPPHPFAAPFSVSGFETVRTEVALSCLIVYLFLNQRRVLFLGGRRTYFLIFEKEWSKKKEEKKKSKLCRPFCGAQEAVYTKYSANNIYE